MQIIKHASTMIHPPIERTIYCYAEWNDAFHDLQNVEFVKGIEEQTVSRENLQGKRILLVIDDLADSIGAELAGALFTRYSHHRSISVVFLVHNLFFKMLRNYRLLALNTQYYIIKKSVRDINSITTLGRQIYGSHYKVLVDAYLDATQSQFGYLFIDLRTETDSALRLRTGIFPDDARYIIYRTKHGKI